MLNWLFGLPFCLGFKVEGWEASATSETGQWPEALSGGTLRCVWGGWFVRMCVCDPAWYVSLTDGTVQPCLCLCCCLCLCWVHTQRQGRNQAAGPGCLSGAKPRPLASATSSGSRQVHFSARAVAQVAECLWPILACPVAPVDSVQVWALFPERDSLAPLLVAGFNPYPCPHPHIKLLSVLSPGRGCFCCRQEGPLLPLSQLLTLHCLTAVRWQVLLCQDRAVGSLSWGRCSAWQGCPHLHS